LKLITIFAGKLKQKPMSRNQRKLFQATVFAVISVVINTAVLHDIKIIILEIITMESRLLQVFCCLSLSAVLATLPITLFTWYKSIKG
jgi:uncharacterized membrane protein YqjE